jgi:ABC-type bacteriocin/lantibiotic exporter with double-glycine peptidase domain
MFKKIFNLLSQKNKVKFLFLIIIYFPIIVLETISLGSIPVYLLFITDKSKILDNIDNLYFENYINSLQDFEIILIGFIGIILIFFIKAIISLFVYYFELDLKKKIDVSNSEKLFTQYLNSPYLFHTYENPTKLTNNINDVKRSTSVLFGFANIFRETLFLISIFFLLSLFSSKIILLVIFIFIIPLIFFLSFFKKILTKRGEISKQYRFERFRVILEAFSNIKFIKITNKEKSISNKFLNFNNIAEEQDMIASFFSKLPRIFLELFAVIIIMVMFFRLYSVSDNINELIPWITLLVISIVRAIPSVGIITVSLNNYRYHKAAVKNLKVIFNVKLQSRKNKTEKNTLIKFKKKIEVKKLSFSYFENKKVLKNINFTINKHEKVGISGPSGKGKSTLLNCLLGLIDNYEGEILCDKINIKKNIISWQKNISLVPQKINLSDDSIKKNIGFVDGNKIIKKKLYKAIKISNLDNFVENLKDKINTKVGFEGSIISGGQLQRIGIARALYSQPKILFLDEPTSSLDKKIENQILEKLFKIKNLTIVVISHNKEVLSKCDKIIKL